MRMPRAVLSTVERVGGVNVTGVAIHKEIGNSQVHWYC